MQRDAKAINAKNMSVLLHRGRECHSQNISGAHILPYALLSSARAWDSLWHDRTTRPSRFSLPGINGFRIFTVLDFLNAHFAIDELVYVCYHHWALYIHESEGRRRITEIVIVRPRLRRSFECNTDPLKWPDHAPVADPGFTKKRPSWSIA